MNEYENNQALNNAQNANGAVCDEIKNLMSSNMTFVAAIITATQILCMLIAGIIENLFGVMLVLSVPFIVTAVEIWVTFGTAKWAKGGVKVGGLITGKVFSIFNIVFTGATILFYFICAVAWSVFSSIIGAALDKVMDEAVGFGDVFGDFASLSNGVVFLAFFISMIPLVINIVLQAQLNTFRNRLIEATDNKLTKRPKTIGIAVMMFLVGLPILVPALILLVAGFTDSFSTVLIGLAYTLYGVMYFYGGVLVIKCGKGR